MSKITNDGLTRSGKGYFYAHTTTVGVEWLMTHDFTPLLLRSWWMREACVQRHLHPTPSSAQRGHTSLVRPQPVVVLSLPLAVIAARYPAPPTARLTLASNRRRSVLW